MKKNYLINSLFISLLASSPLVGAETKYPAADFQPQVVFQDNDYIEKNSRNDNKSVSAPASSQNSASEADPKYPAAHFQPQVVYSDANYKHNAAVTETKIAQSPATADSASAPAESKEPKKEGTPNYLIGLVALALVGVFLMRNQFKSSCGKAKTKTDAPVSSTSGLTGVARYLNKANGTGVSRYLEKQVKSAATKTGVAKYMAKQAIEAKTSATEAATGVEKYLRNRG